MIPRHPLASLAATALVTLIAVGAARAADPKLDAARNPAYGRNYDLRLALAESAPRAAAPAHAAAAARLAAAMPGLAVELDPASGATRKLHHPTGFVTGPQAGPDAATIGLDFLAAHLDALGLEAGDFEGYEITDQVDSANSGVTHLYLRQRAQGLALYNGQLQVHVTADGRILSVNNLFLPRLAERANAFAPTLDAGEAVAAAARHLGLAAPAARVLATADGPDRATRLAADGLSLDPVEARLMLLPVGADARLVWNFRIRPLDDESHYDLTVDAVDGRVWTRFDWVDSASYKVYPPPIESPLAATPAPPADGRLVEVDPATAASPFGWHDTNGAAGAEYTITRGNNVHAWEDSDGNNTEPAPAGETECGASLACEFPLDLTQAPSANRPAAVANLFYWNNVIHDSQYLYGFDEVGGNFQVNNYGNGGSGNDHVRALAQSGAGTCNANFATPPDGSTGRMRMYICDHDSDGGTPARDGDLDNIVIVHEYGHGISNRLVGGPSNVSCLDNTQQPGEGLSDFWGLAYTHEPGDAGTDVRPVGLYLIGEGIRPQPYSTDNGVNTYTYTTIGSGVSVPHGVGSVWAQAFWEVYWALVDVHGFEPDIYDSASGAGNIRALHYIAEGLKNTACGPTFLDVRDGILQAAQTLYGGEDVCRIWEAFAAFGLGTDATTAGPNSTSATNGFATPIACQFLGATPESQAICQGQSAVYNLTVGSAFTPPVTLSTVGAPAGVTAGFSVNPVNTLPGASILTLGNTGGLAAGSYGFDVHGAGTASFDLPLDLDVYAGAPAAPALTAPANGASNVAARPTFTWTGVAATSYLLEVDNDAGFGSPVYTQTVTGTSHQPAVDLPTNSQLYWRVRAANPCGDGVFSGVFGFITQAAAGDCSFDSAPSIAFAQGFESGAAGWTSNGTGNTWAQSIARFHGGAASWKAAGTAAVSDQRLVSPAIALPAGTGITLQYWSFKDIENNSTTGCYDGAILEASTDNVNFTQVTSFAADPYRGPVSTSFSNPIGGLNAWCEATASAAWVKTVTSLDTLAGQTVYFRFRLATDSSVGREGWYVDDVAIQTCVPDGLFADGYETGDYTRWSSYSN